MKYKVINTNNYKLITIINDKNFQVTLCDLGASIYSIIFDEQYMTLTHRNFSDFLLSSQYHGKTIGRVSNRISGNEIKIDDKLYHLLDNENGNTLHGGVDGISTKKFKYTIKQFKTFCEIFFTYKSKDGESGFPGNLKVEIVYRIYKQKNNIKIIFKASTTKKTLCSLTNHSFYSLGESTIDNLSLFINSNQYLEVNKTNLIAVEKRNVDNALDFSSLKPIAKDINNPHLQDGKTKGYDHYYFFKEINPKTVQFSLKGRNFLMNVRTDFEGVQIYSDNYDDEYLFHGTSHTNHRGIALEPSSNHKDLHYLSKGEKYKHFMEIEFKKVNKKKNLKNLFIDEFNSEPEYKVKAGGRVEMIGNHTDHNHGLCCAFTCDLAITGFLRKRKDNNVNIVSIGFDKFNLDLSDLAQRVEEHSTSIGLVRGIARFFKEKGLQIGGFDLLIHSTIYPGAGVSSSAAFESLIGQIFNNLFNQGKVDKLIIAKAGQYAENNDFGKSSGLLDQIGTGYGDISFIDFKDIENPEVERLSCPFKDLNFVLVNTGGSHAGLNDLYSSIPLDMKSAAKKMGGNFLRDVSKTDILKCNTLSEIERSRAIHYFDENDRVLLFKKAILTKDKKLFFEVINGSRESSSNYLKNMMIGNKYEGSPLEACDIAMNVLKDDGACKINGGGFAGSIICIVPDNKLKRFNDIMSAKYGSNNVRLIHIDKKGPQISVLHQ